MTKQRGRYALILRLLLLLLGIAALSMVIPLVLAWGFGETAMCRAFLFSMGPAVLAALPAAILSRGKKVRFSAGDGFLLVFLAWVLTCALGAAPFCLAGRGIGVFDALFESVSGFTTTGATVFADVESLPRSLVFWRAMTHWLGGMGIVVLTVALLPLLGAGGFQLLRAESPGPESEKITPRITGTAKILWGMYLAMTVLETALLMLGGMDWFDAVVHSFATVATGGFSSRNGSIAAYQSPFIDWVCIVFMLVAGCNFTLIYRLCRGKLKEAAANSEARAYGCIILVSVILIGATGTGLRQAFFQAASILSTTGFTAADHARWHPLAQGALFFLMFIGGCSGSTAGGIKVIRHLVFFKQAGNEMKRLLYPRGVFSIRLDGKAGKKELVYGVTGFMFLYFLLVLAAALLVSTAGSDLFTSLNAGLLTLGNIGLGIGKMGPGSEFSAFPAYVKGGLSFIMIAGRLELWTVFVFFSRDYWST
ncbi:MAG: TrkH family potassium uptake protein [Treponema sp.]|jgi:trk system potassium uptake protein TrkH|nr:TrkH family potassium uptake protein [Treponema sp.]